MARQYSLPGGTLSLTDPDPLEVAKRRAEIDALLQKPVIDRGTLALQQWEAQQRGQIAAGQHQLGVGQLSLDQQKLAETLPIEKGKLTAEQQRVADESSYRKGSLAEETRFHNETVANEAARVKAGLVGDTMTHILPGELAGQIPKGTVEALIGSLGYPDLAASMKSVSDRATIAKAIAFADQNKTVNEKQFGAVTAGLPPGTEDTFRNAAWNRYKSVHPEVYGKDVATAAEAALQPPAPTPTAAAAPTTGSGAYVAPAAGSPSVGWAMGPDSPLASTTPGVSEFGPKNPQMGLVDPTTNDVIPLPGGTVARIGTTPPVNDIVKAATMPAAPVTATAPQVAPVVAGAPTPVGPPQPSVTTNALSFNGQPLPISLGFSSGQSEQARELEAERKRQALALLQGSR